MKRRSIIKSISGFISGLCFWRKSEAVAPQVIERSFEERFEDGKRQYATLIAKATFGLEGKLLHPQYEGNPEKVMQTWVELEKGSPKKPIKQEVVDERLKSEVATWNQWATKRNLMVQGQIEMLKMDMRNDGSDDWGRMVKEKITSEMKAFDQANPAPQHPIAKVGFVAQVNREMLSQYLFVPLFEAHCPSLSRTVYERTIPALGNGWSEVSLKQII